MIKKIIFMFLILISFTFILNVNADVPYDRIEIGKSVTWIKDVNANNNVNISIPNGYSNLSVRDENNNVVNDVVNRGRNGNNRNFEINGNFNRLRVEYTTPAPTLIELSNSPTTKRVRVSSGDNEGYTNVNASIYLPRVDLDKYYELEILWENENIGIVPIVSDTEQGLYVEWNVPHLSDQDFSIILNTGVYVNNNSVTNYRDIQDFTQSSTFFCNNLTMNLQTQSYNWYINDVANNLNQSNLTVTVANGFSAGTNTVSCQINGINSTNRNLLDTTLGDFNNGTFVYVNQTYQQGNITSQFNENNLKDTNLLFHFDENYTLNTNLTDDVSIYNNNGVCINMTSCPVFNSTGYIGGAFEFDGVNDYISLGDSLETTFVGLNKTFSISAWIKPASTMTNNHLVTKLADSSCSQDQRQFNFRLFTGSKLEFLWFGDLLGNSYRGTLGTTAITNTNSWYYVVMTYNGNLATNSRVSLYVNGVAEGTSIDLTSGSPTAIADGTAYIGIGKSLTNNNLNCGSTGYFNGSIDEVRIMNRSLTADEIYRDYQAGLKLIQPSLNNYNYNGTFQSQIFDLGTSPNVSTISWGKDIPKLSYYYPAGLVFYWDGSNLFNSVNSSLSLVAKGGLLVGNNASVGHVIDSNSTTFDGVDDLLNVSISGYGLNYLRGSINVWVYPKGYNNLEIGEYVVMASRDPNRIYLRRNSTSGNLMITLGSTFVNLVSTNITSNKWHHISMTWNNGSYAIYLNGLNLSQGVYSGLTGVGVCSTIGSYSPCDGNPESAHFNGSIDEVAIWDRALTGGEVSSLYNNSLQGNIKFQTRLGNNLTDQTNWGEWGNTTATGINATYTNSTGQLINYTYNGSNRYIQYRALFETLDGNVTPILKDVVLRQIDFKYTLSGVVFDATNPIITLTNPTASQTIQPITTNFTFSITDSSFTSNCSLILVSTNNFFVTNNLTQMTTNATNGILFDPNEGNYQWSVRCTDIYNNVGISSNRTLVVALGGGNEQQGGSASTGGGSLTCPAGTHESNGVCITNDEEFIEEQVNDFEESIKDKFNELEDKSPIIQGISNVQKFLAEKEIIGLLFGSLLIIWGLPKKKGRKFKSPFIFGILLLVFTYFAIIFKGYINLINYLMDKLNPLVTKTSPLLSKIGSIVPVSNPQSLGILILVSGVMIIYFLNRKYRFISFKSF